jgi:rubrerythrin
MPEFINPFTGMTPARKLTDSELARALRLDLSAEEEAVHIYQSHADATENELARMVLLDIADEERVHVGEFQRLINILLKDEENFLADGAGEVNEMARGIEIKPSGKEPANKSAKSIPTIGSLK